MAIVVNGITIPTNVANALNVNGTNITSVICNGTTVWAQSLNLTWSGSSLQTTYFTSSGLSCSGSSYMYDGMNVAIATSGGWQSVSSSGVFSGNSIGTQGNGYQLGFSVSGNLIKAYGQGATSNWVTYTLASKQFSGSSYSLIDMGEGENEVITLETSGGLIRFGAALSNVALKYGPWISLT